MNVTCELANDAGPLAIPGVGSLPTKNSHPGRISAKSNGAFHLLPTVPIELPRMRMREVKHWLLLHPMMLLELVEALLLSSTCSSRLADRSPAPLWEAVPPGAAGN